MKKHPVKSLLTSKCRESRRRCVSCRAGDGRRWRRAPLRLYIRPRRALQLAPRLEPSGPRTSPAVRPPRPPRCVFCVCEERLHRFSFAAGAEEITHIELLSASCECRHWHYSTLRPPFIRGISASRRRLWIRCLTPRSPPLLYRAVQRGVWPRPGVCTAASCLRFHSLSSRVYLASKNEMA